MSSRRTVLIADNSADVCEAVKFRLDIAGYQVFTASSIEQALEILQNKIVHLVVIDKRLKDDERPADQSGYDLARLLPDYIPHIIFTAYEDIAGLKEALKVKSELSLSKVGNQSEAILELIKSIDMIFQSKVRINVELELVSELNFDELANQIEVPHLDGWSPPNSADALRILQTLFYEAVAIEVESLLPSEHAPTVSQSGSALVLVRKRYQSWGQTEPVIVKFGALEEIEHEAENHRHFTEFLRGCRHTMLGSIAKSRQIGGLVYSLIDTEDLREIRTFEDFFLEHEAERVSASLERFFGQVLAPLFKNAHPEAMDLTVMYTAALRLTAEKLDAALELLHPHEADEPHLHMEGLPGAILNPLVWLRRADGFRPFKTYTWLCLCHGDLHGRNILVDASDHFWLIDFARVEQSHALRDFAELESDIKFHLLRDGDLRELLPFEQALLAPLRFGMAPPLYSFANARIDKAYQVVSALRRLAAERLNLDGDMREYYQALLFHTLNILRLKHIGKEKKEHALMAASLICQRLDSWPIWELPPSPAVRAPEPLSPTQAQPEQLTLWTRVLAAGSFMLAGSVIVLLCFAAMSYFNPSWQQQVMTLIFVAVLIIAAMGVVGLVSGTLVVTAIQSLIASLLGGVKSKSPGNLGDL